MTKLELLPNELFLNCFEYLHNAEIFDAFGNLNCRFDQLIRAHPQISLHYQPAQKPSFDEFCMKMRTDPELKGKIHSIKLSNEYFPDQIQKFLSWFSLDEFPHLQALSLTNAAENDQQKLDLMLPSLTKLVDFRVMSKDAKWHKVCPLYSFYNLRRVTANISDEDVQLSCNLSQLTHLTLSQCSLSYLCKIFTCTSLLKYLNIENLYSRIGSNVTDSAQRISLIHLKKIILSTYSDSFENFEHLMSFTPNLQYLTISRGHGNLIDAPRWEKLINSSLHHLKVWNFSSKTWGSYLDLRRRCEQFQTRFWLEEHHWCTNFGSNGENFVIHTIPLINEKYILQNPIAKYELKLPTTFAYVRTLNIFYDVFADPIDHQFPCVTSLTLYGDVELNFRLLNKAVLEGLSKLLNLSNLKHLCMYTAPVRDEALLLLEILQRSPQLSSLALRSPDIVPMLKNEELCNCLNRMIKKIDCHFYWFTNLDDVKHFCQVFSNIQQLKYYFHRNDQLIYLLNHLPHLSTLEFFISVQENHKKFVTWFKTDVRIENAIVDIEEMQLLDDAKLPCIHIDRNFFVWIKRYSNKI